MLVTNIKRHTRSQVLDQFYLGHGLMCEIKIFLRIGAQLEIWRPDWGIQMIETRPNSVLGPCI